MLFARRRSWHRIRPRRRCMLRRMIRRFGPRRSAGRMILLLEVGMGVGRVGGLEGWMDYFMRLREGWMEG